MTRRFPNPRGIPDKPATDDLAAGDAVVAPEEAAREQPR